MAPKSTASSPGDDLQRDLREVIAYLRDTGVVKEDIEVANADTIKKMHAATYSMMIWRFYLDHLPECGKVFLEELASDSLQILPHALSGYKKTTALLTRSTIENLLRHVFFTHHPIEFVRSNRMKKWYVTLETLFDYLKEHPDFYATESKFDAINRLKTLYDELSADVHGRRVEHLEMRRALSALVFDPEDFRAQVAQVTRCAEAVNFVLLRFHHGQITSIPPAMRSIVLGTMDSRARRVLRGLE